MKPQTSVLESIGNTPLIRLKRASEETGCTILGKAEFLNPGQSVKDRAALAIVEDAERKSQEQPDDASADRVRLAVPDVETLR